MDEIAGFLKFKHPTSSSTCLSVDESVLRDCVSGQPEEQNHKIFLQTGRWSLSEQCEYLRFIESHKSFLVCKEERRSAKIFKLMSKFIKSRGPDQCRSHHQKMQKKYDTITNIIANCQKNLSKLKKRPEVQQPKLSVTAAEEQIQALPLKMEWISQQSEGAKLVQSWMASEKTLFSDQKCCDLFDEIEPPCINEMFEVEHDNLEVLLCDSFKY